MKRPASLTIVVVLQWISAIIGIVGGVIVMISAFAVTNDAVREAIDNALDQEGVTGVTARTLTLGIIATGLITVVVGVVRAIIARSLGRGKNWARVLLTVLGVLNLISAVLALFGENWAASAVTIAIEVIILWLMWNAKSSAYIKAAKAAA